MAVLPASVKVGPYTFRLTEAEADYNKACADNEGAIYGYVRYGKQEIIVDPEQGPDHKRAAVLHEVLHAVWHLSDWTHKEDEMPMRVLATGILMLLQDNPALVTYLTEKEG